MTDDPRPPFEMVGGDDGPACADGVCGVPAPDAGGDGDDGEDAAA